MLKMFKFISMVQTALVDLDPLIIEASRSCLGTPQSVVLLLMSDQPNAETST